MHIFVSFSVFSIYSFSPAKHFPTVRLFQPCKYFCQRRFSTAAFSCKSKHFTLTNIKRHIVHPFFVLKPLFQMSYRKQRIFLSSKHFFFYKKLFCRCIRQKFLCIFSLWIVENIICTSVLYHFSVFHNINVITSCSDHPHIMTYKKKSCICFFYYFFQQPDYSDLHRRVKRRRRFVCHDQIRFAGKGNRNNNSLSHSSGKFKRILFHP